SGTPLVTVEIDERNHRYLAELEARRALLDESLASIDSEVAKLSSLAEVMTARIRNYRSRMLERLAAETREAEAALASAQASRDNAEATFKRAEALVSRGHATAMRVEADAATRAEAVAEVSRLKARLDRVGIETAAVEAGVFVQEGWNDVPYSQQRIDGIDLSLADLATERRRIAGEHAAIDGQINTEMQLIAERETFIPMAPSAGVIWKQSGAAGETVVPGDVLVQMVDCDARFLEVTLAERHFGSIVPGDLAWVRLKGGTAAVAAPVTGVLGAGAKFDHPRLAASVSEAKPDQLRVLISLRGAGIDGEPGAFCNVGRTAEVRFERRDMGVLRRIARAAGAQLLSLFANADPAAALVGPVGARHPVR
ncbi:MAG TPA: HlyD family efflux transporter periplasmic adaptor subunit, partial [Thermohalobaculum sp.]|nr:HlyD family efflux transporter periplasmic adaptor subunit [Thermohalobaculum sp.]